MLSIEKKDRYTIKKLPDTKYSGLSTEETNSATNGKKAVRCFRVLGTAMIAAVLFVLSVVSPTAATAYAETPEVVTPAVIGNYDGTMSPSEYYQAVEKFNLNKQIDTISSFYGRYLDNYKESSKGVGAEVNIKAEFDPSIAKLIDLEGLKSLKASIVSMQTDKKSQSVISLFTNDKQFTSLEVFADTEKELIYLLIPELSKAYLKISTNPDYADLSETAEPFTAKEITELLNNNPLTEELLNQLLKKYSDIVIGEINDVSIANDNITVSGVNADETRMTVKLEEETLLSIAKKVLTAAKTDKDLQNLSVKFKICKESEYVPAITEALNQISNEKAKLSKSNLEKKTLIMKVWADKEGNVTGRDFTYDLNSNNSLIGYKTAKNGSDIGIEAWYAPDKEDSLKIAGKVNTKDTGISGNVNIIYNESDILTLQTYNVKLENFAYTIDDLSSYINGRLTVTGGNLSGVSIVADFAGDSKQQTVGLDFIQEANKLVSVTIDSKVLAYKDFELPSQSAKIYDIETQIEDYISSADFEKYLQGINKKIDVKGINAIIDQMLYGYSYQPESGK